MYANRQLRPRNHFKGIEPERRGQFVSQGKDLQVTAQGCVIEKCAVFGFGGLKNQEAYAGCRSLLEKVENCVGLASAGYPSNERVAAQPF